MDEDYRRTALTVVVAVFISVILFISLEEFIISPYLHATNREVNIFELYDHNECNNTYFIGSSQIGSGIDARMIGQNAYNLGSMGDTPLRRLIELNRMIAARPHTVIIGLTYYELNESSTLISQTDYIAPVSDKIGDIPRKFFSDRELEAIDAFPHYYNRKFLLDGISVLIGYSSINYSNQQNWNVTNFTIPENHERNNTHQELMKRLSDRAQVGRYVVSDKDCSQKDALNYTICRLRDSGVNVMVINMPLNPLLSARISNETRKNYFNFLNQTGVKYYDFERACSREHFVDLTHLNSAGRKRFTELLCPIVP
jgi:hypothetical protein